jgi:hypothetical protein
MIASNIYVTLLVYTAAAVVLAVVAAEIYLRIRYKHLLWIHVYPRIYIPDEDLGYRYRPNAEGEIRIAGIHRHFRTNSRGFHDREFALEKPPGTYRIAVIGPSNTTGIWMDGSGKTFSEMLEEHFRKVGRKVEVMNFGIDGRYRSVHELRIIDTDVARCDPDLVLLDVELPFVYGAFRRDVYRDHVMIYNAENELSRRWCELTIDYVLARKVLIRLYNAFFIVRAAARYYMNHYNTGWSTAVRVFVENRIQAPDIQLMPYSLKKSVDALKEAREKLHARGAELILFQYFASDYFRHVVAKYELPYIELDVPPIPRYVHDLDGHYRHEGHVAIARQFFDQLTWRGILDAEPPRPKLVEVPPAPVAEELIAKEEEVLDDGVDDDVLAAGLYGLA